MFDVRVVPDYSWKSPKTSGYYWKKIIIFFYYSFWYLQSLILFEIYFLLLPLLYTLTQVHVGTYTWVSNKQSIEMWNSSSACYCFVLTSPFQSLLEMFPENNSASQGCSAHFVLVPGLVRIPVVSPSEAVSLFKLSPLMLQVEKLPCLQSSVSSTEEKAG